MFLEYAGVSATEAGAEIVITRNNVVARNLYAQVETTPNAGSRTFRIRKNRTDPAGQLIVVITPGETMDQDTTNSMIFNAHDRMALQVISTPGTGNSILRASVEIS